MSRATANKRNRQKSALERWKKQLEAGSVPTSKRNDQEYIKKQIEILEEKVGKL